MDDHYQGYVNRVVRLVMPETYQTQLPHIQASPKFQLNSSGQWQTASFPGYTIITPPWCDDSGNQACYQALEQQQRQLQEKLDPKLFIPVQSTSFHVTLADLIWENAYLHAAENPEFETNLRNRIADIFQELRPNVSDVHPTLWQVLGITVMPRAIGVVLAPKGEDAYNRVIKLRRALYQNADLIALGIEQQYYFTAHVTLGYLGQRLCSSDDPAAIGAAMQDWLTILAELNEYWQDNQVELTIRRAELRKFDDMNRYYRQPSWPVLEF